YPDAIRLSCFQHCKRKFLNITGNKDAEKIVRIINRLYQNEHRIPPDWTACQILDYRNKYAPPILKELKEELINIKNKKSTLPKSELSKAINYTLIYCSPLCFT
ncbi:IS66 family transposase, partial [Parabacteroides merdae]|uniref:IS66 family transposase n=1 Tax=Parabacteroides merdae TaxID=46503 RepID=UPI0032BFD0F7